MSQSVDTLKINKRIVNIVQINLGDLCNQACLHCHIEASPEGKKVMDRETAELVLGKILEIRPKVVEFTGSAPEMNPNFGWFIETLTQKGIPVAVMTNIAVCRMSWWSPLLQRF